MSFDRDVARHSLLYQTFNYDLEDGPEPEYHPGGTKGYTRSSEKIPVPLILRKFIQDKANATFFGEPISDGLENYGLSDIEWIDQFNIL